LIVSQTIPAHLYHILTFVTITIILILSVILFYLMTRPKAQGTGVLTANVGGANIPYQVKLVTPSADTTNLTPGTTAGYQITSEAGVVLATGEVVDTNDGVTDATGDLQIKISEGTRVPNQTYIDTVTLVFSAGLGN